MGVAPSQRGIALRYWDATSRCARDTNCVRMREPNCHHPTDRSGCEMCAAGLCAGIVCAILLFCVSQGVSAPPAGATAPRYSPPDLPAVAKNQLDVLGVEIAQNNLADAARRIDSLLKDSPEGLIEIDDADAANSGGMISLQTWIEQLPEAQRTALVREYRVQFEDAASRSVRQLAQRKSVEPAQFLAIARRYPFAPAATDAIVAAAQRSAELGDTIGAANLFGIARSRGWKDKSSDAPSTQPSGAYSGPLPFQVPWFANLLSGGSPTSNASAAMLQEERLMPVTNGGVVYMSASRGALALKEENDAPLWQVTPAGEDAPPTSPRPSSRGASFAPALLCDDQGTARIVVVRQMGATGDYGLRAMRASDGKRLWSTDNSPDLRGLTIASNPALAGRYVYALGVDVGEQADRLVMLAFEVTSGRVLWRSEIGAVARRGSGRFSRSRDPVLDATDPWQNISAPAVDADSVYLAPNSGAVIAVDRFDGHLRWIRPYATLAPNPALEPGNIRRRGNVRVREAPSTGIPRSSVFRWNTTPVRVGNDMLVVAPQDTDRVFALSSRTGKNLWHTDSLAQATLFGAADKLVFLSDRSITALDVEKLDAVWTWDGGAVGPATISTTGTAPQILVPTAGGLVTLDAKDGAVVGGASSARVPDLSNIAKSETVRTAMQATGALDLLLSDDNKQNPATPQPTRTKRNR